MFFFFRMEHFTNFPLYSDEVWLPSIFVLFSKKDSYSSSRTFKNKKHLFFVKTVSVLKETLKINKNKQVKYYKANLIVKDVVCSVALLVFFAMDIFNQK